MEDAANKAIPDIDFKFMSAIMHLARLYRPTRLVVKLSGIKEKDVVLEYGCGPGFQTFPAAKVVGSGGLVYALDNHPRSIEIIREKIEAKGLENIRTILAGENTGLADNSVDLVLMQNVLPMVENRPPVIREIHRVLKPGGWVFYKRGFSTSIYARLRFKRPFITTKNVTDLMQTHGPLNLTKRRGFYLFFSKER